jgi:hypothetical protein
MQFLRMKRWMVGGAVALSLALGAVGVVAFADADAVLALEDDTELDGVVEVMPDTGMIGTWQVGGQVVQVTETTAIDQEMGALAVGVAVEVEGETQPDGSILASELEVEDNR